MSGPNFETMDGELLHPYAAGRLAGAGSSVLHSLNVLVGNYSEDMSAEARNRLREARNILSVALQDAEAAMSEHKRRTAMAVQEMEEIRQRM